MTQEEKESASAWQKSLKIRVLPLVLLLSIVEVTQKVFGADKLPLDQVQCLSQRSGTTPGVVVYRSLHPPGSLLCGIGWSSFL